MHGEIGVLRWPERPGAHEKPTQVVGAVVSFVRGTEWILIMIVFPGLELGSSVFGLCFQLLD